MKRRTEALDKINWVIHQKGKAAEVLTEEYMSSEVSESEEECYRVMKGVLKKRSCISERLRGRAKSSKQLKTNLMKSTPAVRLLALDVVNFKEIGVPKTFLHVQNLTTVHHGLSGRTINK